MGKKLTVFMIDGTATGPKTIEIGNWSGQAIFIPRASLKSLLKRNELSSQGIYLLQSESTEAEYQNSIYIGEAEKLCVRLKQHIINRDFESVICFSSKDKALSKAHIKYIEAKLIQLTIDANTTKIENRNIPKGSALSEADESDANYFIEQIKLILPLIGIKALVPATYHSHNSLNLKETLTNRYQIKSKNLAAYMIETPEGFVVLEGSEASPSLSPSIAAGWINLRKKLMDAKVLEMFGDKLIFKENTTFSSPSAASSVILGRQSPGPISWLLPDGRTFKEVQSAN